MNEPTIPDVRASCERLLPPLYAAAVRERPWKKFLEPLREIVKAKIVHVMYADGSTQSRTTGKANSNLQWIEHLGLSVELLEARERYGEIDPWLKALIFGGYPDGIVLRGTDVISEQELLATQFYKDILQQVDVVRAAATLLFNRNGEFSLLSLLNGLARPEFDDSVLELLRALTPHLQSAVRVYNQTGEAIHGRMALEMALEQFSIGVFVLDKEARVLFADPGAERLAESREGLAIEDGVLRVCRCKDREWKIAIQRAALQSEAMARGENVRRRTAAMRLDRREGPELQVYVTPWLSSRHAVFNKPAAVALVSGAGQDLRSEILLQEIYGLTPAEARVATLTASGMSAPEVAKEIEVTPETVRTRLKAVFGKTDTRRQSDLARLLARLPHG